MRHSSLGTPGQLKLVQTSLEQNARWFNIFARTLLVLRPLLQDQQQLAQHSTLHGMRCAPAECMATATEEVRIFKEAVTA